MFKKLRTKFILTNLLTTTVVLAAAFSMIYVSAATDPHPPIPHDSEFRENTEVLNFVEDRLNADRQSSLQHLLITLILSGFGVEVAVFCISFYLAELSIRPVRETYNAQKAFIANASHEIKTPLAVIQANLEAADIQDNHWIDNIAAKTEELANLNNQLLSLARLEAGDRPAPEHSSVVLPDTLEQLIRPLQPQIDRKSAQLKLINHDGTQTLQLSAPDLRQILNILLDNAIKYCDHHITVTIDHRQITIANDGATISPKQLPHIFERFYQTDKTKSGVGLGLSIAHQLAENNGWTLTANSSAHKTSFILGL